MSQLFYYTPSGGDWNKALPIGNGKLGAMIFGEGYARPSRQSNPIVRS